jgi:glycosyltransferase involved in cell wall biosynthesis
MRNPEVSILMPVYNGSRYLAAAIDSMLSQDFADFEFVIVDDGSTDNSLQLLTAYAKRDNRIRLITRANTGIVGALNDGLEQVRALFVARMDADDLSLPGRLRKQRQYLLANDQCVAVGSHILLIDNEGWPICEMCKERTHEEIDTANLLGGGAAMNHPSVMFRAEAVRRVGGYRQQFLYAEDLDLWLRLAEVGGLYNLPETLLHYRMHSNSISHAKASEQRRKWRLAVEDAQKRRGCPVAIPSSPIPTEAISVCDHHIRWAWQALMAGNVGTARKHALRGLRHNPFSLEIWRLACCAARGY